ncbi:MAG: hypothetical protein C5S38_09610 [Candidatus Methanophagaceae archaeon]|nr:MAG: hypothetical protein C5S38_09610 [Methanophagales archaeon]KAF5430797.1 Exosortase/Archaeosortase [Methanophagales archaeon]
MSFTILPFIAIGLFLLGLVFRKRGFAAFGWVAFASYSVFVTHDCFVNGDYFYTVVNLVFLVLSLLLAFLMVTATENDKLFFSITRIAFITAALYFPFAEIPALRDSLIHITAKITANVLNILNPGSVYMNTPLSYIYSTYSSCEVEIILACTAIESIVLFAGIIFGVHAPMKRKLKAFFVSVPVIYALNIFRNVFVITAYFDQWFASPSWVRFSHGLVRSTQEQSFDIAHNVLARMGSMVILIIIAYAVFMILPEVLDLIDDLFRVIRKKIRM